MKTTTKIVTITVMAEEASSDFPKIISESAPGRENEAINNIKGACLHVIADWDHVPDVIEFKLIEKR